MELLVSAVELNYVQQHKRVSSEKLIWYLDLNKKMYNFFETLKHMFYSYGIQSDRKLI